MKKTLVIALAGATGVACSDSTDVTVEDLTGTWAAIQYVFTNQANAAEQVDLIATGASFVMTVTSDGTVSTVFADGQGGTSSDSGTLTPSGTTVTLDGVAYEAQPSGSQLRLINQTSAYDFDSDGSDDAATLEIVMVRQ